MKILFTPSARIQFLSALAYIRRDKPDAALRFRQRAETVLKRLLKFPESGRVIPEFPELSQREVVIAPYRFFYRVKGKVVWIVGVLAWGANSECSWGRRRRLTAGLKLAARLG